MAASSSSSDSERSSSSSDTCTVGTTNHSINSYSSYHNSYSQNSKCCTSYDRCCTNFTFLKCSHCQFDSCLSHLVDHLNLLNLQLQQTTERVNTIQLPQLIIHDNRLHLQKQLDYWKQNMLEKIENIHHKKSIEIRQLYMETFQEFEHQKIRYINKIKSILLKEDQHSKHVDKEYDEIKMSLLIIQNAINELKISSWPPINGDMDVSDDTHSTIVNGNDVEGQHIVTVQGLERTLNSPCLKRILMDNECCYFCDTSNKYILVYDELKFKLKLFTKGSDIIQIDWNKNLNGEIVWTSWCTLLEEFFILSKHSLFTLNCSSLTFTRIHDIHPLNDKTLSCITNFNDSLIVSHEYGTYISHYLLSSQKPRIKLMKKWFKTEMEYERDDDIMSLHLSTNNCMAMNIHLKSQGRDKRLIDFVNIQTMERLRRINPPEFSIWFLLDLSNQQWLALELMKEKNLFLLESNGDLKKINIRNNNVNITGAARIFGGDCFVLETCVNDRVQLELYKTYF